MRIRASFIAALLVLAGSVPPIQPAAATPPPPMLDNGALRSLAGGYRALTTCSAIFNARRIGADRTAESVAANELVAVYPELQPYIADGEMVIAHNHVLVRWDASQPPAIAYWQPVIGGCTLLRPGAPIADVVSANRPGPFPMRGIQRPWPRGDDDFLRTEREGRAPIPDADRPALFATRNLAFGPHYGAGTNTTAVVVVRGDVIVAERYAPGFETGTPQRTWSVAKSLAATIIGAAVQRGEVDINAPAAIANWQREGDPRRAITIGQLLRMSSGLTSDSAGNRTDAIYFGGATVDEDATRWPLIAAPGSVYRYANNDTLLAVLAISPTFTRHPPRDFFASIDMHSTVAETDWRGNYVLSSQVWATARDLARFGMLYLNNGVWNGRRILPEDWRDYVTTPGGPQPAGDFGYGAGFWLMNRSEGVPPDAFAAFGNRGQYVVIVPSRNIVIVRRGEDPAGRRFDIAAFTRDVLAALPALRPEQR
jgi:CubicO group peptidase (beta-lactamase class C family)